MFLLKYPPCLLSLARMLFLETITSNSSTKNLSVFSLFFGNKCKILGMVLWASDLVLVCLSSLVLLALLIGCLASGSLREPLLLTFSWHILFYPSGCSFFPLNAQSTYICFPRWLDFSILKPFTISLWKVEQVVEIIFGYKMLYFFL